MKTVNLKGLLAPLSNVCPIPGNTPTVTRVTLFIYHCHIASTKKGRERKWMQIWWFVKIITWEWGKADFRSLEVSPWMFRQILLNFAISLALSVSVMPLSPSEIFRHILVHPSRHRPWEIIKSSVCQANIIWNRKWKCSYANFWDWIFNFPLQMAVTVRGEIERKRERPGTHQNVTLLQHLMPMTTTELFWAQVNYYYSVFGFVTFQ